MELRKDLWIISWLLIIYSQGLGAGKSATKVGLAGISTVAGGASGNTYTGDDSGGTSVDDNQANNGTQSFANAIDLLKNDLFIRKGYDRSLRPVVNPQTIIPVTIDFTVRQILDLDEKNQILKSYLWMRTSWTDEFLTWNASEYNGKTDLWVLASTVWRPDIVVYEDTGIKDYSPRLPYLSISNNGKISYAEPTTYETTCSINIAFFPFDYQICTLTFTSWTFPSSRLDVMTKRAASELLADVKQYFIKSGEWLIDDIRIEKTSENFGSLGYQAKMDSGNEYEGFPDTSKIRRYKLDPTKRVQEVAPDRITRAHWADIKFTFSLRRNSSLYMQSMLFPAILLTTVALLGFYLPPDSGERIGLQITILLTFMVFLLTVGEMFPASTGPFLGVYYVLCMALLGVNLFMTVLVLHLHYMPSAAIITDEKDKYGRVTVKPVPRWVRVLLYISKFSITLRKKNKPNSPSTKIVDNIIKTGRLYAPTKCSQTSGSRQSICQQETRNEYQEIAMKDEYEAQVIENGFIRRQVSKEGPEENHSNVVNTKTTSVPTKFHKNGKVSPHLCTKEEGNNVPEKTTAENLGIDPERITSPRKRNSADSVEYDNQNNTKTKKTKSVTITGEQTQENQSHTSSNNSTNDNFTTHQDENENIKILDAILHNVSEISSYMKSQNENLQDTNISGDIENEWKAMARTIDHLCMRFYVALLVISHVSILVAALVESSFVHSTSF